MASFWEKVRAWLEGAEEDEGEGGNAPGPLVSQDEFAALLIAAAERIGVEELAYDDEDFCLRGAEGAVSWLHNRYEEYLRCSPDERERLLQVWAEQLAPEAGEITRDWTEAAPHLRPRVRSRFFVEGVGLSMQLEGRSRVSVPWEPVGDHLVVTPVYDLPTMMSSVGDEHLQAWGVDLQTVLRVAMDNLREDGTPVAVASLGTGVRIVHVGDDYDSSRMLLPELLAELELAPEIVALPATRAHLFLATTADPEAMGMLLELARRVQEEPRLETLQPVVYRRGSWHSWEPAEDLPSRADWRELILLSRAADYQQQAELLRALLERSGIELELAEFRVLEDEDGPWSATTWPSGPALLPEAEWVQVPDADGSAGVTLRWSELRRLAGRELRRDPERWPPRWRVEGPPSPGLVEALAELRLAEPGPS